MSKANQAFGISLHFQTRRRLRECVDEASLVLTQQWMTKTNQAFGIMYSIFNYQFGTNRFTILQKMHQIKSWCKKIKI
jgi:hypothetical protein